jgi:hypothetical protein
VTPSVGERTGLEAEARSVTSPSRGNGAAVTAEGLAGAPDVRLIQKDGADCRNREAAPAVSVNIRRVRPGEAPLARAVCS